MSMTEPSFGIYWPNAESIHIHLLKIDIETYFFKRTVLDPVILYKEGKGGSKLMLGRWRSQSIR